ncbi:MAG: nucleotidyltransferase family protein [Rhodospirillales bacterium]
MIAGTTAGLVLAAGLGRRFGGGDKLLADFRGQPLIRLAARAALDGGLAPVVVVLGPDDEARRKALDGLSPLTFLVNPSPENGMGSSLALGITALMEAKVSGGAAVLLADMPLVTGNHVARLRRHFESGGARNILAPSVQGRRGHPVFWPNDLWPDLAGLAGDRGGRDSLNRNAARLELVELADDGVLVDVDRPSDLLDLRS